MIFLRLLAGLLLLSGVLATTSYPSCANLSFNGYGALDIETTLYNCAKAIPGSLDPPSYYPVKYNTSIYSPTNISVQMAVSELISVDDISAQITIEMYLRFRYAYALSISIFMGKRHLLIQIIIIVSWVDNRISLENMWAYLNPQCYTDGIDISLWIRNTGLPLNFWLPDVTFYQSLELNFLDEAIKLFPNGTFYWSRHIVGSFPQPQMNYKRSEIVYVLFHIWK
jgi:hypothetical protein